MLVLILILNISVAQVNPKHWQQLLAVKVVIVKVVMEINFYGKHK
jgi:hypothetical protein